MTPLYGSVVKACWFTIQEFKNAAIFKMAAKLFFRSKTEIVVVCQCWWLGCRSVCSEFHGTRFSISNTLKCAVCPYLTLFLCMACRLEIVYCSIAAKCIGCRNLVIWLIFSPCQGHENLLKPEFFKEVIVKHYRDTLMISLLCNLARASLSAKELWVTVII